MSDTPSTPAAPSAAPQEANSTTTPTETTAQSAQGSDNAKPAGAGEEALRKFFKVKVDGADMEVDEQELVKGYQLAKASYNKMTEAAKIKKAAESDRERFKREPDKVFQELGMDPLDFAEQYIMKVIEQEKMTPEQRKLAEREARIRELEKEQMSVKEQREAQEYAQLQNKVAQDLENQFMKTFQKQGLEMDPYNVKRMAEKYYLALEDGIDDPDLDLLAELVTEDLQNDLQKTLKRLPMDKLLKFVGDDILNNIRTQDLARLKNPPSSNNRPSAPANPKSNSNSADKQSKREMSTWEWREELERMKNQK